MRTINLTEVLTEKNAQEIIEQFLLLKQSKDDITFVIETPGGGVLPGIAIRNVIEEVKETHRVITISKNGTASIGVFLLSCGSHRLIGENAGFMFHSPTTTEENDAFYELKLDFFAIVAQNTRRNIEDVTEFFAEERTFAAKTFIEYGFADEIISDSV